MGRIRYIKPDFFIDQDLGALSPVHRLCYAGLWCAADREGRIRYELSRLKLQILPYDKVDFGQLLTDLCKKPFICIYENEGRKYIQIIQWKEHQRPHHTEKKSLLPAPNGCLTVKTPLDNGCLTTNPLPSPFPLNTSLIENKSIIDNTNRKWTPPTLEELTTYCKERQFRLKPSTMHDYYTSNGWRVGRGPMKDWRAAARNWEARERKDDGPKKHVNIL